MLIKLDHIPFFRKKTIRNQNNPWEWLTLTNYFIEFPYFETPVGMKSSYLKNIPIPARESKWAKKNPYYFPLYWLVNKDPYNYNGLL